MGTTRTRVAMGAILLSLLAPSLGLSQDTPDELTKHEWKCEQATTKSVSEYFGNSLDCFADCRRDAASDPMRFCSPFSLDTTTRNCLSRRRAPAEIQILKSCSGAACPECYFGGNCPAVRDFELDNTESFVGTAFNALLCDDLGSPDGLNKNEAKCQDRLVSASGRLATSIRNCLSKCHKRRQNGDVPEEMCRTQNVDTPSFDAKTQSCVDRARKKFLKNCPSCFDRPECWDAASPPVNCSAAVGLAENWALAEDGLFCVDQPICGDGRISPPEECDTNAFPVGCGGTDFCNESCGCEPAPDRCAEASVVPPSGGFFTGTTSGPSTTSSFCGGAGAEQAFVWTPALTGTATIDTCGSSFDTVVSVRTTCDVQSSELTCNDDVCGLGSLVTPFVQAGVPYYILVDGLGSFSSGPFELRIMGTSQ